MLRLFLVHDISNHLNICRLQSILTTGKAILLDSGIGFDGSFEYLWKIQMNGHSIAAVSDRNLKQHRKRLGPGISSASIQTN